MQQQNYQNIKQQFYHSTFSQTQFAIPGQIISNPQIQQRQFDSSLYHQISQGLTPLYCGFPSISVKSNALVLTKFPIQYIPSKNDLVIGFVKIRTAETFVLDIAGPMDVILGGLEFDGATKRNKPNLKIGTPVFCRVTSYSKHTGGKVSCLNKGFVDKKGSNQLGELREGFIFWVPQFHHQLIQKDLLQKLGKCAKFQVAFGKNGRIWVNSSKSENTMLIINIFKMTAGGSDENKINSMISLLK